MYRLIYTITILASVAYLCASQGFHPDCMINLPGERMVKAKAIIHDPNDDRRALLCGLVEYNRTTDKGPEINIVKVVGAEVTSYRELDYGRTEMFYNVTTAWKNNFIVRRNHLVYFVRKQIAMKGPLPKTGRPKWKREPVYSMSEGDYVLSHFRDFGMGMDVVTKIERIYGKVGYRIMTETENVLAGNVLISCYDENEIDWQMDEEEDDK